MLKYLEMIIDRKKGGTVLQEAPVSSQEYQRKAYQKAVFPVSAVLFAGLLMLAVNFAESTVIYGELLARFGDVFRESEWIRQLTEIAMNLLLILLPGVFLLAVFRKNPLSPFAGPLSTPKYPFLFVPMCIGALYALNFSVSLIFGDLLTPFDRAIDPSSYPVTLPGMLLYMAQIAIFPALFEEWLFRGIMLRQLIPSVGKWPAVVLSAFVFGLMHLNPAQSVFAFAFGLFVGYAYIQTGSIWFGVLIHMLNNAISCCAGYWTDLFGLEAVELAFGSFLIVMMVFGIVSLFFYQRRMREVGIRTRRTREERLLPDGKTVFRAALHSPMLYLMVAAYGILLWLYYLYTPS